jgi:drug/metabolite transporter (DMT)-like permease
LVLPLGHGDGGEYVYLSAAERDLLSLVGVIAAMYPVSTMALARIVLHERLTLWG